MNKENDWKEVSKIADDIWDREGSVQGIYVELKEGVGPNLSKMYHLRQPDGTTIGAWGSTVLDTKMTGVKIGEEIKIKRNPDQVGKSGKKYIDFAVYHRLAPMQEVDVADISIGEPEEEPEPIREMDTDNI